jgi:hypothetical protein
MASCILPLISVRTSPANFPDPVVDVHHVIAGMQLGQLLHRYGHRLLFPRFQLKPVVALKYLVVGVAADF